MAALDALKGQPLDAASRELIRKSLASKSNFLVAKAARLAEENQLADFVPGLTAAFERFFVNAEKSDPQCWAKNALSRALSKLGCRDKDVFLRGLHHHQMEPVWGGRSDSAGTLRANCAHALLGCDGLIAAEVLSVCFSALLAIDRNASTAFVARFLDNGDDAAAEAAFALAETHQPAAL